jgi:glycosyltransferase involved in cell wall biosynthesis
MVTLRPLEDSSKVVAGGFRNSTTATNRILLDLTPSSLAGQRKRALAFLERVRKFDARSALYVFSSEMSLPAHLSRFEINLNEVALGKGRLRTLRRLIWQNVFLPRVIEQLRIDTYLSFSHYLPVNMPRSVASVVGISNLAPFSDLAYEAEPSLRRRFRLAILKRTVLSSARRAARVVALSQACRDVLMKHGIDGTKVAVISNGCESPAPSMQHLSIVRRFGLHENYVLCVSHFYPYKNLERLIEAYSRLEPKIASRYRLVLVGSPADSAYFRKVQTKIASLNASRILVIPGLGNEELGVLYSNASAFIFPSLVEACPNSLLEAMWYGLPIVAGNIEPMREFAGNAGSYFDPLSVASISEVLGKVLCDEGLREHLGRVARARSSNFSWDRFTGEVVNLYSSS